ncbi:MAG: YfiR family protein, partial [Burkholderiaceae bacterium]|nr:YfiR family protein [Burkholderiaceae bacterium]
MDVIDSSWNGRRSGRCGWRRTLASACLLAFWFAPQFCLAQAETVDPRLKVAFVYNFLKFTEWPGQAGNTAPLTLCVMNADNELESAFAALNGRVANGRAVTVRAVTGASGFAACHAIFVSDGAAKKMLSQFGADQGRMLTIGDAENFVEAGGIIGLTVREGKLRFEINLDAARQGGYQMSAQLLKLARNTQTQ